MPSKCYVTAEDYNRLFLGVGIGAIDPGQGAVEIVERITYGLPVDCLIEWSGEERRITPEQRVRRRDRRYESQIGRRYRMSDRRRQA